MLLNRYPDFILRIARAKLDCPSGTFPLMTTKRLTMRRFTRYDPRAYLAAPPPQVRLRGEVHRLVAPRDQKYQSNFVEVRPYRLVAPMAPCSLTYALAVPQLQDCISALCWTLLLPLCRLQRQRASVSGSYSLIRRSSRLVPSHATS